jgi:hypothetical protein
MTVVPGATKYDDKWFGAGAQCSNGSASGLVGGVDSAAVPASESSSDRLGSGLMPSLLDAPGVRLRSGCGRSGAL